eukprot:scaffold84829_cov66-Phaeocystis_antarctica.AAC.3
MLTLTATRTTTAAASPRRRRRGWACFQMLLREASVGLVQQRLTLSGSEVAPLGLQQPAEVSHVAERVRMPITERLAPPFQHLA